MTASLAYTTTPTAQYTLIDANQGRYTFDGNGRLTTWRDAEGHQFDYTYNGQGRLFRVTEPGSGRFIELGYDGAGRLQTVKDHTNRQVSYGYNGNGDLTTVTDVLGRNWTYVYSGTTRLLSEVRDPNDSTIPDLRTEYDGQGRAIRQYNGLGVLQISIQYNLDGTTIVTNSRGITTTHTYDSDGTLVDQAAALGAGADTVYDFNYRPSVITDSRGAGTSLNWSQDGATLNEVTDALSQTVQLQYDDQNNLTRTVDARGNATTMAYSGTLMTGATNALSQQTIFTYTTSADAPQPPNLLLAMQDARGNVTRYQYDSLGQTTRITDTAGVVTAYEYDMLGRLITTTVALGRPEQWVTVNQYDSADRLARVTDNVLGGQPQNHQGLFNIVTQYGSDEVGNQIAITDTLGQVTRNAYDNANRLIATTRNFVNGQPQNWQSTFNLITQYGYDSLGNQTLVTDTLGQVRRTDYDALNRPVTVTVNFKDGVFNPALPAEDVQWITRYDSNGNVTESVSDANVPGLARTTRTEYDLLNRPVTVTTNYIDGLYSASEPDRDIQTLTRYDANGNITETVQFANVPALARATRTEYDVLNRPVTVTVNYVDGVYSASEPDRDVRTVTVYDANGNVQATIQFQGVPGLERQTRIDYDRMNRPVTTTVNYVDGIFNPAEPDRDIASVTGYDALERAITMTQYAGIAGLERRSLSEYDRLGRVVTTTANFVDGVFAAGQPDRDIRTLTGYDALGNVITATQFANVPGLSRVTRNQLDTLYRPLTVTANFTGTGVFNPAQPDRNIAQRMGYDPVGNRLTLTEVRGGPGLTTVNITTTYGYDSLYRPVTTSVPLTGTTTASLITAYDGAGRTVIETDPLGKQTRSEYDLLGGRCA